MSTKPAYLPVTGIKIDGEESCRGDGVAVRARTWVCVSLLFFLTINALSVFLKKERVPRAQTVFIAAAEPQIELIPLYLARVLGSFKAAGIDVRFTYTGGAPLTLKSSLTACNLEELLQAYASSKQRLKVVLMLTQQPSATILSRHPDFSWTGLKGKTIITPEPTHTCTVLLEELLRQNGIYPHRDVALLMNIPRLLRLPAFLAGVGDYALAPEPAATILTTQKQAYRGASLRSPAPLCITVLAAPEEWACRNQGLITAFRRAATEAGNYLYTHPASEIAWLVAPYFPHVSLSTLSHVITQAQRERVWYVTAKPEQARFAAFQQLLHRSGELVSPFPYTAIFFP